MTTSVNLVPNSERYTLGPDISVNTGFFQILPVILVTQQYNLYLGLLGQTIYLLLVVLHPLQSFRYHAVSPGLASTLISLGVEDDYYCDVQPISEG